MTRELDNTGIRIHDSRIRLRYRWWVGESGGRFYKELVENSGIWGTRCPLCERVYVPPKRNCPKCFSRMHEWIEVSHTGNLMTYTMVHYSVPHIQPHEPPFALGIIRLDGADTGITHLLGEVDLDEIRVGMKVQAVFRDTREGNLMDIKYFRPMTVKDIPH